VILNSRVTSSIDQGEPPMDATTPGAQSAAAAKRMIGLGRPWRAYARTVYINTSLPAELNPAGWNNWGKKENEGTAWYAEFGSTGPGANASGRVSWAHTLKADEVKQFLPASFLGGADHWNAEAAAAKLP
jgi:pectinesterase